MRFRSLCVDTSNTKNRSIGKQIYTHIFSDHAYLRLIPAVLKVRRQKEKQDCRKAEIMSTRS